MKEAVVGVQNPTCILTIFTFWSQENDECIDMDTFWELPLNPEENDHAELKLCPEQL